MDTIELKQVVTKSLKIPQLDRKRKDECIFDKDYIDGECWGVICPECAFNVSNFKSVMDSLRKGDE